MDQRRHAHDRPRRHVLDPDLPAIARSHQLDATAFATHHFTLDQFMDAYDVFTRSAETGALKVVLTRAGSTDA